MNELEKCILCMINEIIEGVYTGNLKVLVDDDSYMLKLYLNRELTPIVLYYEGNESGFLRFVEKDLRSRQLSKIQYAKYIGAEEDKTEYITIN